MGNFHDVIELFTGRITPEDKYKKILELGRTLPSYPEDKKTAEKQVVGCQSLLYLHSECIKGKMHFWATSDALISAGLAALLLKAYHGAPPEFVLKNRPSFLEELQILSSLSPSRSNGLASLFLKMQQDTLLIYSKT